MTTLNLSNQTTIKNLIAPKVQDLKTEMEKRKAIWNKLPVEKKKKWITSDKDPIMTLAWNAYVYLRDGFFKEADNG